MSLTGKTAVVTGGAKGIGYAIARRFLRENANVVIADSDDKAGEAAVEEFGDADIRFVSCDVSDRLDVRNLMAETVDAFDTVDILVNNAGIVHKADFLDLDLADFERVMAVNLTGAFLVGQAAARHMVEQVANGGDAGAIINIGSINDRVAIADQTAYSVSKGGLAQLTKTMALSLAPHGIRVNAIGPGSIMTDILSSVADDDEARARILSRTPLRRIGDPSEIAGLAAFLASDDASYITGETVYADGGRLALNYTVAGDAKDR